MYTLIDGNYDHVGAVLADAVLQSNNNYERNVRHRIARILEVYRTEVRLSDLLLLLQRISAQEFLDWQGTRRPKTFLDLVNLLSLERVDSVDDMRKWLSLGETKPKLLSVKFVGAKTADYLKILVGYPTVAIDRHLLRFIALAGLGDLTYSSAQDIVLGTAGLMRMNPSHLDHSIWRYMTSRTVERKDRSEPALEQQSLSGETCVRDEQRGRARRRCL